MVGKKLYKQGSPKERATAVASKKRKSKYYSVVTLFSGCGGFDLGAEATDLAKVVFAIDNDHWAVRTYERNLGTHVWCEDVRTITPPNIDCDILLASPPCQDFSSLWNHDGANTERGALFREVSRFLLAYAPKAFVLENVAGLLSANQGQAWTVVRQALRSPGLNFRTTGGPRYRIRLEKLNMADLGVPQSRERIIVIGIREDLGALLPPTPVPYKNCHRTAGESLEGTALPSVGEANHFVGFDSKNVVERLKLIKPGQNYKVIPEGHPLSVKGLISHVYKRLDPDKPSYTVIASGGGGTHGYHYREPRRLSNRERARLQTFPDNFLFDGPEGRSGSLEYAVVRRQIGNAVPPEGAQVILNNLFQFLLDLGIPQRTSKQINKYRSIVVKQNKNNILAGTGRNLNNDDVKKRATI